MNHKPRKNPGFTLIEIMVVLTLLAILLGIVALNATRFLAPFRLNSAARQVATDLQLTRMKAITQNRSFRALFTAGDTTYRVQRNNGSGNWKEHALYGHGTTTTTAQLITLPQGVQISSGPTDGDIVFQSRGTGENATITLKHPAVSATKSVTVNLVGQVKIQ